MKHISPLGKVLICLTAVFVIMIIYNKVINISSVKTAQVSGNAPLGFVKINDSKQAQESTSQNKSDTSVKSTQKPQPADITPININTATLDQLGKISGIGPAIAQRIIDFRTQNGSFKTVEEIMLVSGIGESTFQKIKPYICVQ